MKNILRPSRHILHDEEPDQNGKRFDFGHLLNRYRGNRSVIWLVILISILGYLVFFLNDFPIK